MKHIELLKSLDACNKAIEFASNYSSLREIWDNCPRGDWMLWLAYKLNIDYKHMSLAKGYCAKTVYHLMSDEHSKDAVIAAINYGRGLISKQELNTTVNIAYAANAAANAAAYAAYAANAAAYAAYGNAAAYAATAVTNTTANQLKTANICRKYLTAHINFDNY